MSGLHESSILTMLLNLSADGIIRLHEQQAQNTFQAREHYTPQRPSDVVARCPAPHVACS